MAICLLFWMTDQSTVIPNHPVLYISRQHALHLKHVQVQERHMILPLPFSIGKAWTAIPPDFLAPLLGYATPSCLCSSSSQLSTSHFWGIRDADAHWTLTTMCQAPSSAKAIYWSQPHNGRWKYTGKEAPNKTVHGFSEETTLPPDIWKIRFNREGSMDYKTGHVQGLQPWDDRSVSCGLTFRTTSGWDN